MAPAGDSFQKSVDVLDVSKPSNLTKITSIDLTPYGIEPKSVAVPPRGGKYFAVSGTNALNSSDVGKVLFFTTTNYSFLGSETLGAVPHMLTFTEDALTLVIANLGELEDSDNP